MKLSFISAALVFVASSALAQHAHQSNSPSEIGQSQFAAIAEIVTLLRDDPETDWAQVDIKALRDHLVDMDNVTTKASVNRKVDGLSVNFTITGGEVVAASIRRMVLAHSPMLQRASDWTVLAVEEEGGAKMLVEVRSDDELSKVLGLGFFGLMTIGAHHQQHHLMIATGRSPH
jgi:hypothetical protein